MANWLIFEKIKEWDAAVLPFFQYDYISNSDISDALADPRTLRRVNPALDWEDDHELSGSNDVPENRKHAYRVAALVRDLLDGNPLQSAIQLDTFLLGKCGCGIGNGHHRIRALQFLGVPCGPFGLSGYVSPLERLVRLAGTESPRPYGHFFSPSLRFSVEDDISA